MLLEEEQIAFVMADKMAGSRKRGGEEEKEVKMSEHDKQKMSIAETRISLPIYKFRDDLLQAIKDHQVLIIEGKSSYALTKLWKEK